MIFSRIADRSVLCPSKDEIPHSNKARLIIEDECTFELFIEQTYQDVSKQLGQELTDGCIESDRSDADLFVLKFPGAGGRAERATVHPAGVLDDLTTEVWTVNPPGFGKSPGRASLSNISLFADASFERIQRRADGRPILITGNSLGNLPLFYLAAKHNVAGLLCRNPPPLREVIRDHHARRFLNWAVRGVANSVPSELCTISNAGKISSPVLFVVSEKDETIPVSFQQQIIAQVSSPHRVFTIPDALHATPIAEEFAEQYKSMLGWLFNEMAEQMRNLD